MDKLTTPATKDPEPGPGVDIYGDMDGYAVAIRNHCQSHPDGKVADAVRAAHQHRDDGNFGLAITALESDDGSQQHRGWELLGGLVARHHGGEPDAVVRAVARARDECTPHGDPGTEVPQVIRQLPAEVRWTFHLLYAIAWGWKRTSTFDSLHIQ